MQVVSNGTIIHGGRYPLCPVFCNLLFLFLSRAMACHAIYVWLTLGVAVCTHQVGSRINTSKLGGICALGRKSLPSPSSLLQTVMEMNVCRYAVCVCVCDLSLQRERRERERRRRDEHACKHAEEASIWIEAHDYHSIIAILLFSSSSFPICQGDNTTARCVRDRPLVCG